MVFMTQTPDAYVICMGDFNMLLNPRMDSYGKKTQKGIVGSDILEKFINEAGVDLWSIKNPNTRA